MNKITLIVILIVALIPIICFQSFGQSIGWPKTKQNCYDGCRDRNNDCRQSNSSDYCDNLWNQCTAQCDSKHKEMTTDEALDDLELWNSMD